MILKNLFTFFKISVEDVLMEGRLSAECTAVYNRTNIYLPTVITYFNGENHILEFTLPHPLI